MCCGSGFDLLRCMDTTTSQTYWISRDGGDVTGPFTMSQLRSMWMSGQIFATAQVCEDGGSRWRPVTAMGLDAPVSFTTTQRPINSGDGTRVHSGAYRVICFFFGLIGVHNFFAGEVEAGICKAIGAAVAVAVVLFGGSMGFLGWIVIFFVWIFALADLINGPSSQKEQEEKRKPKSPTPEEEAAHHRRMVILAIALSVILVVIWIVRAVTP